MPKTSNFSFTVHCVLNDRHTRKEWAEIIVFRLQKKKEKNRLESDALKSLICSACLNKAFDIEACCLQKGERYFAWHEETKIKHAGLWIREFGSLCSIYVETQVNRKGEWVLTLPPLVDTISYTQWCWFRWKSGVNIPSVSQRMNNTDWQNTGISWKEAPLNVELIKDGMKQKLQ